MSPKQFLQLGGVILVLFGLLGVFMPVVAGGLLNFTDYENYTHLLLGIVALVLAVLPGVGELKKWVVVLVGLVALYFGVIGFTLPSTVPNFYGVAHLDNPVDNIIHLVVGVWALVAAFAHKGPGVVVKA